MSTHPAALLTTAQVAKWLGVSRRWLVASGVPWLDLRPPGSGRALRRYDPGAVVAWLAARRVAPGDVGHVD